MSGLFQRFSTQGNFCSSPNVSHSPEIHGKNFKYQNNRFPSKQPVGSHKDGFLGNAHGSWVANWASSDGKNNFRRDRLSETGRFPRRKKLYIERYLLGGWSWAKHFPRPICHLSCLSVVGTKYVSSFGFSSPGDLYIKLQLFERSETDISRTERVDI